MPWTASDAQAKTRKAKSPTAQRQWSFVANSAKERGLSDGEAIREANGVIRKRTAASKLGRVSA